jgi:hypothetical protein
MSWRLWLLLAAVTMPACGLRVPDAAPSALDIRCVSWDRIGCGCSLSIDARACEPDSGRAHFASELHQGAPLWINLGGREFSLPSRRSVTNSFYYSAGDSWIEEYYGENVSVVIRYRPGKSTCQRPPEDDGCEYFDVAAEVTIRLEGRRAQNYRATGACGC